MELPEFDEFLASLDKETFEREMSRGTSVNIIDINLLEPGNIQKLIELIYHQSVKSAVNFSLNYLRLYHEWLRSRLEEQQNHPA